MKGGRSDLALPWPRCPPESLCPSSCHRGQYLPTPHLTSASPLWSGQGSGVFIASTPRVLGGRPCALHCRKAGCPHHSKRSVRDVALGERHQGSDPGRVQLRGPWRQASSPSYFCARGSVHTWFSWLPGPTKLTAREAGVLGVSPCGLKTVSARAWEQAGGSVGQTPGRPSLPCFLLPELPGVTLVNALYRFQGYGSVLLTCELHGVPTT